MSSLSEVTESLFALLYKSVICVDTDDGQSRETFGAHSLNL